MSTKLLASDRRMGLSGDIWEHSSTITQGVVAEWSNAID